MCFPNNEHKNSGVDYERGLDFETGLRGKRVHLRETLRLVRVVLWYSISPRAMYPSCHSELSAGKMPR